MSKDNKNVFPVGEEKEEVELSPAEIKASEKGWKPQDEYEGDDWVSAEIFNMKADMIGQILRAKKDADSVRKEMQTTKKTVAELEALNERILKADIEKQKKALKEQKLEAQESGDYRKADAIDDEIKEVEKFEEEASTSSSTQTTTTAEPSETPQEIIDWYTDHEDSMVGNEDFKDAAESNLLLYAKKAGAGANPADAVAFVDSKLKRLFPAEYGVSKRTAPPSVENGDLDESTGSTNTRSKPSKYTLAQCNEQEKKVARSMAQTLGITPDEYVQKMAKDKLLEIQN